MELASIKKYVLTSLVLCKGVVGRVARWFIPRPVVALTGISGAGKSTLTKLIFEAFRLTGETLYVGENAKKVNFKSKIVLWGQKKQHGRIGQRVFLFLMPFEMWFRYLAAKKNPIIVMDRYPFRRPVENVFCRWFNLATRFLLPRPDVLIVLTGDVESIWKRKRKSVLPVAHKEYDKCLSLCEEGIAREVVRVDVVEQSPPECFDQIMEALLGMPSFVSKLTPERFDGAKYGAVGFHASHNHYKCYVNGYAEKDFFNVRSNMDIASKGVLSRYVPEYEFWGRVLRTLRYDPLPDTGWKDPVKEYLSIASGLKAAPCTLADVVDFSLLKNSFGKDDRLILCEKALRAVCFVPTFAHRDFHADNLLWNTDEAALKIIDWGDVSWRSCHHFDALSFGVHGVAKKRSVSWLDALNLLVANPEGFISENGLSGLVELEAVKNPEILSAFVLDNICYALDKRNVLERMVEIDKQSKRLDVAVRLVVGGRLPEEGCSHG